jgi:hypothetical protein
MAHMVDGGLRLGGPSTLVRPCNFAAKCSLSDGSFLVKRGISDVWLVTPDNRRHSPVSASSFLGWRRRPPTPSRPGPCAALLRSPRRGAPSPPALLLSTSGWTRTSHPAFGTYGPSAVHRAIADVRCRSPVLEDGPEWSSMKLTISTCRSSFKCQGHVRLPALVRQRGLEPLLAVTGAFLGRGGDEPSPDQDPVDRCDGWNHRL